MNKILHWQINTERKIVRWFKNKTWLKAYLNLGQILLTAIFLDKNLLRSSDNNFLS